MLLPETQIGRSSDLKEWLPIEDLYSIAMDVYKDSVSSAISPSLDKIDIRKEKGIVKFIFHDGYWGIQLDGATGEVLQIDRRWSDMIEHIHDGSIIDDLFGIGYGLFKLFYTSLMGIGLLIFVVTGIWLWYIPKKLRKQVR